MENLQKSLHNSKIRVINYSHHCTAIDQHHTIIPSQNGQIVLHPTKSQFCCFKDKLEIQNYGAVSHYCTTISHSPYNTTKFKRSNNVNNPLPV